MIASEDGTAPAKSSPMSICAAISTAGLSLAHATRVCPIRPRAPLMSSRSGFTRLDKAQRAERRFELLCIGPIHLAKRQTNISLHLPGQRAVSYTHLRAHETPEHLVCRLL